MTELLDELERALTDLMQMGLATAGPDMANRMKMLSERAGQTGLHTGSALFAEIAVSLTQRSHTLDKTDLSLTAIICRAHHYITLCRTRLTEENIRSRWQEGGQA